MPTQSLAELLQAWRAAERHWERAAPDEAVRAAAHEVLGAWTAYQDAALPQDSTEFMLVADDDGRYVGATLGLRRVLSYEPDEISGKTIGELAAPELQPTTMAEWTRFLATGRQDGTYSLLTRNGIPVSLHYQARAHHPIPGFHVSRLWPDEAGAVQRR